MRKFVKKKAPKLLWGMLIYAAIFLVLAAGGLVWFWNFINAYELSRPQTTMDTYLEQLPFDTVYEGAKPLVDQIDSNLQTPEQCKEYIRNALSGGITYAKNLKECTDGKTVYMLISGGKTIGKTVLAAQPKNAYGFTDWVVAETTFDFSCLMGKAVTLTVDRSYTVRAGDFTLTQDYVTKDKIEYAALKEFYSDYQLPYLATYEAGPVFGELVLTVTDAKGAAVAVDENTDVDLFLNNCTEKEIGQIQALADGFVQSYVHFTACTGNDSKSNYRKLAEYLVPNGPLVKRMYDALDGLSWVSDRGAYLDGMTVQRMSNIGSGKYLCDVTYDVRHSETMKTTSNLKLIMAQTDAGLRVEAMYSY